MRPPLHRIPVLSSAALSDRVRQELELFFLTAAALEGKDPAILGWGDAAAALALVRSSLAT